MRDSLSIKAPAKVNLCLHVLGKRSDGYHNIASIMQAVSVYDEISLKRKESGITLTVEGAADLSAGPDNLVYQAAQLILSRIKGQNPPITSGHQNPQPAIRNPQSVPGLGIRLRKNIPIGAGLGGGSSDAAATLLGLNKLLGAGLSEEELLEAGAGLGADVPFFLAGGPALAEGVGERLTPLPKWKYYLLLVYPKIHISTATAYKNLNFQLTTKADYNKIQLLCYHKEDMGLLCQGLKNDFEPSVIREYPVIEKIKDALVRCGAQGSLMSGTGASVFGLFRKKSDSTLCRNKFVELTGHDFWIAEAETI